MPPSSKTPHFDIAIIGIILVQLILIILMFDLKLFMGGDAHVDILLAKSILSGNGFRDLWSPGNPPDNWRQPGAPVIMALLFAIFGQNYLVVKIFIALLACGITVILYLSFKDVLKKDIWYVLILFIANGAVLEFSHYELTEIPYLFMVVLCFYFWKRKNTWATLMCLVGAYYLRTDAFMLLAAFLIYFLIKKDWKKILMFGASYALGVLPWIIRSMTVGGNRQLQVLLAKNEYAPDLGLIGPLDLISRILSNMKYYFLTGGGVVVLNVGGYLTLVIMVLALIGLLKFYRRAEILQVIVWFVACHTALFLIWQSSAQYYRYFIAISPFLMIGFMFGFYWLVNLAKRLA